MTFDAATHYDVLIHEAEFLENSVNNPAYADSVLEFLAFAVYLRLRAREVVEAAK